MDSPASPLGGLSPADLLRQGAAEDTLVDGGRAKFEPPSPEEIARIFPQFEVLGLIGQGGMGAVYQVRQRELDRVVALKILPPSIREDASFADRFAREAKALAKLNHPGIVTIHEFGRRGEFYFIVMEFVDGVNLRQLLQRGRISPREALAIVPQVCDALQFAHDHGIVHRDIKPENLLIDRRGRVKVADFGLAKLVGGEPEPATTGAVRGDVFLTEAGKLMGTPDYMAPEQVEHPADVDHRADIYSLGVVLYQMLTGELPGARLEPPSRKVQLDVRLDEVVLRALERNPELRFQEASVMKTRVEEAAAPAPPRRRNWDLDYRSKATWFGWPLLHVTSGPDPATGKERVARGVIAIGGRAQGLIAFGGVASGGLAFGGIAAGVVAIGGIAVGLFSYGGLALALLVALGGLAVAAWVAMGGGAFAYLSYGGAAGGVHVLDPHVQDPVAKEFFMPWAIELLSNAGFYNLLVVACVLLPGAGVPMWLALRRDRDRQTPDRGRSGLAAAVGVIIFLSLGWSLFWWLVARGGTVPSATKHSNRNEASGDSALSVLRSNHEWSPFREGVAEPWLQQIDAGDLGPAYVALARIASSQVSADQWATSLAAARGPLGALVSREFKAREWAGAVTGLPEGQSLMVRFTSKFERKESAVENVVLVLEDNQWKPAGYFVR